MAKMELDKDLGIKSISGAISRQRRPDGTVLVTFCTKKGRIYTRVYKRTTPVSDKERNIRAAFSIVASEVARRKHKGDTRPRAVIWNEVKKEMEAGQVLGKCYASAGQLGNDGDI